MTDPEMPPWHPIEYETLTVGVSANRARFERATWIYTPLKNGGFSLKFSWYAWILRKVHGPDASKVFWFFGGAGGR